MSATHQVIKAANERASALAAGDARRLHELLHEQFRWTTHLGQTFDRSEYIRRNTEGDTVWLSQSLPDTDVVVVGQTAVLYGEVTDVVSSSEGEQDTFRMPMTQVWVLVDGRWQCLAGHAGPRQA
jgi:ketosteroid isomerase-like protein